MQVSVVTKKESLSLICAETETTVLLKCLQAAYGIAQMPAGAYRIAQMPEAHKCVGKQRGNCSAPVGLQKPISPPPLPKKLTVY